MTEAHVREVIFKVLSRIAPEADPSALDPKANLREAVDIGSFDHLNRLIGLNEEFRVEIPEADYGQLTTLADIIRYLIAHMR